MGLGQLFTRNIQYDVTDTQTGDTDRFTVITDGGPGMYPDWGSGEYRGAMGLPGAWRASVLLSDLLGGVPWHAYRDYGGRPVETISAPLLEQPNPPDTRVTTFSSLALDLLYHGNGVGVYTARNLQGYPTACVPVSAESAGVFRAKREAGFTPGEIVYDINGSKFHSYDVLHIKGPSRPGCLRGMGVLEAHFDTLRLGHELNRQARAIADSAVPTGYLQMGDPDSGDDGLDPDTDDDIAKEAKRLKAAWMEAQRTRTVAVLNPTTTYESLSWDPTQTQLLEARKLSMHELALIFGLDPSWLGVASNSMTYSNIEQEAINLNKYSLGGHIARFEQGLSLAFPTGTKVKANLDSLLRSDTLSRYQAHEIALRNKFLTVDEVRQLEDMPPLTDAQKIELKPAVPPQLAQAAIAPPEGTDTNA